MSEPSPSSIGPEEGDHFEGMALPPVYVEIKREDRRTKNESPIPPLLRAEINDDYEEMALPHVHTKIRKKI